MGTLAMQGGTTGAQVGDAAYPMHVTLHGLGTAQLLVRGIRGKRHLGP